MRILPLALVALSVGVGVDAFTPPHRSGSARRLVSTRTSSNKNDNIDGWDSSRTMELEEALEQARARRQALEEEILQQQEENSIFEQSPQTALAELEWAKIKRDESIQELVKATTGLLGPVGGIAGVSLASAAAGRNALRQRKAKIEEEEQKEYQKRLKDKIRSEDQKFARTALGGAAAVAIGTAAIATTSFSSDKLPSFTKMEQLLALPSPLKGELVPDLPYLETRIKEAEEQVQAKEQAVQEANRKSEELQSLLKAEEEAARTLQAQLSRAEESAQQAQLQVREKEQALQQAQERAMAAEAKATQQLEEMTQAAGKAKELEQALAQERAVAEDAARQAELVAAKKSEEFKVVRDTIYADAAREEKVKAEEQALAKQAEEQALKAEEAKAMQEAQELQEAVLQAKEAQAKAATERAEAERATEQAQAENDLRALKEKQQEALERKKQEQQALELKTQEQDAIEQKKQEQGAMEQKKQEQAAMEREKQQAQQEEQRKNAASKAAVGIGAPKISQLVSGAKLPTITADSNPWNLFNKLTQGDKNAMAGVLGGSAAIVAGTVALFGMGDGKKEKDDDLEETASSSGRATTIVPSGVEEDYSKKTVQPPPPPKEISSPSKFGSPVVNGSGTTSSERRVFSPLPKNGTSSPFSAGSGQNGATPFSSQGNVAAEERTFDNFGSPKNGNSPFASKNGSTENKGSNTSSFSSPGSRFQTPQNGSFVPSSNSQSGPEEKRPISDSGNPKTGRFGPPPADKKALGKFDPKGASPSLPFPPPTGSVEQKPVSSFENPQNGKFAPQSTEKNSFLKSDPKGLSSFAFAPPTASVESKPVSKFDKPQKGKFAPPPADEVLFGQSDSNSGPTPSAFASQDESVVEKPSFAKSESPQNGATSSPSDSKKWSAGKSFFARYDPKGDSNAASPFASQSGSAEKKNMSAPRNGSTGPLSQKKGFAEKESFPKFESSQNVSPSPMLDSKNGSNSPPFASTSGGTGKKGSYGRFDPKKSSSSSMAKASASNASPKGSYSPFSSPVGPATSSTTGSPSTQAPLGEKNSSVPLEASDLSKNLATSSSSDTDKTKESKKKMANSYFLSMAGEDMYGKGSFAPFAVSGGNKSESPKGAFEKRNIGSNIPPPSSKSEYKESASATPPGKTSFSPFGGGVPKTDLSNGPKQNFSPFSLSKPGSSNPASFIPGTHPAPGSGSRSSKADSYFPSAKGTDSSSQTGAKSFVPFDPPKPKSASDEKKPFLPFQQSDQSASKSTAKSAFKPFAESSTSSTASSKSVETSESSAGKPASSESYLAGMSGTSSTSPSAKTSYSPFGSSKGSTTSIPSTNSSPFGQWTPGSTNQTRSEKIATGNTESTKPSSPKGSYFTDTETPPIESVDGRKSFMPFDRTIGNKKATQPVEKKNFQPFGSSKPLEKKDDVTESSTAKPASSGSYLTGMSGASSTSSSIKSSYSPFGSSKGSPKSMPSSNLSPFGQYTPGSTNQTPSEKITTGNTESTKPSSPKGSYFTDTETPPIESVDGRKSFMPFDRTKGDGKATQPVEKKNFQPFGSSKPFAFEKNEEVTESSTTKPASSESHLTGMSGASSTPSSVKSSYSPFGSSKGTPKSMPSSNYSPFGQWTPGSTNQTPSEKITTGNTESTKPSSPKGSYFTDTETPPIESVDGRKSFMPFDRTEGDKTATQPVEKKNFQPFGSSKPFEKNEEVTESSTTKPASSESYLTGMSGASSTPSSVKSSYSPFGSSKGGPKSMPSSNYSPFGQWTPGSTNQTPSEKIATGNTESTKPSSPKGSYFTDTETPPIESVDGRKSFMPFDRTKGDKTATQPVEKKNFRPLDSSKPVEKKDSATVATRTEKKNTSKSAWSSLQNVFSNLAGNSKPDGPPPPLVDPTEQDKAQDWAPSKSFPERVSGSDVDSPRKSYSPFASSGKKEASHTGLNSSPFSWSPGSTSATTDASSSDNEKIQGSTPRLSDSYLQSMSSTDSSGQGTFAPFAVKTGGSDSTSPKDAFTQRNALPQPPPPPPPPLQQFPVEPGKDSPAKADANKNIPFAPASTLSYLETMSTPQKSSEGGKTSYSPFAKSTKSPPQKQSYAPFGWSPGISTAAATPGSDNETRGNASPAASIFSSEPSNSSSVPDTEKRESNKIEDTASQSANQDISSPPTDTRSAEGFSPFAEWLKNEDPASAKTAIKSEFSPAFEVPNDQENSWFDITSPKVRVGSRYFEPNDPVAPRAKVTKTNVAREGEYLDDVRKHASSFPNNNWFDSNPSQRREQVPKTTSSQDQYQAFSIDPNNNYYKPKQSPSQPNGDAKTGSQGRSKYFDSQPSGNWFDNERAAGSFLDQNWQWFNN
eukprot:scaffold1087_cov136-Cylindrotheca_fusiformis.AAC.4